MVSIPKPGSSGGAYPQDSYGGNDWKKESSSIDFPPLPNKYAHEYPRYIFTNFPDGSSIKHNFTEGNQYFAIEGREGDRIGSIPGGGLHLIAQKGLFTEVKGPIRTFSTGAQDTIARGAIGIRAAENINVTTDKDHNTAVKENMNSRAKNINTKADEKIHTAAQDITTMATNAVHMAVSQGSMTLTGAKGVTVGSKNDSAAIYGAKAVTLEGFDKVAITAGTQMHMKIGDADIMMDGTKIFLNCGKASPASQIYNATKIPDIATYLRGPAFT